MTKHSILRVHVQSQYPEFGSPDASSRVHMSTGSAWVCDARHIMQCTIPVIPEGIWRSLPKETIARKLQALGLQASDKGEYPVIVTNAHVVEGMKSCNVQLENNTALHACRLLCIFESRDLAILLPPDNIINQLHCSPLCTEELNRGDEVSVYGYPKNGDGELSLTDGKLSRTIYDRYAHANLRTIEYEMTATINGGNSGGPVVMEKEGQEAVVAIAHQQATNASNQFNAIPVFHLIAAFKNYVEYNGKKFGLPALPISTDPLKNQAMRQYYGLTAEDSNGVLISEVSPIYESPFQPGDVLLSIGPFDINSE